MELPAFKYHPAPLQTGSIKASGEQCRCCGAKRGFIYTGPVYAGDSLRNSICPWCIKSGEAAQKQKFDAEFNDFLGIKSVTEEIAEEVCCRTLGFSGWQQERWWTHCQDAGAYLGTAEQVALDEAEIRSLIEEIQSDFGALSREDWQNYFRTLDEGTDLSVYVFRCLHCGKIGGYADSS